MRFQETNIPGCFVIELDTHVDERGFFAETFNRRDFEARGLAADFVRSALSFNIAKGTLRGMHFQQAPFTESKLVHCTRGAIFDVAVDLRPDSESRNQWFAETLTSGNRRALYVPEGCAHGFQTLDDSSEVTYQLSNVYSAKHATGVCWDDPLFDITWPLVPTVMSHSDRTWPHVSLVK